MAIYAVPIPHATAQTEPEADRSVFTGPDYDPTQIEGYNEIGGVRLVGVADTSLYEPGDLLHMRITSNTAGTPPTDDSVIGTNQVTLEVVAILNATSMTVRVVSLQGGGLVVPAAAIAANRINIYTFEHVGERVPHRLTLADDSISGFVQAIFVGDGTGLEREATNQQKGDLYVEYGDTGHIVRHSLREGVFIPASTSAATIGAGAAPSATVLINEDLAEEFVIIIKD